MRAFPVLSNHRFEFLWSAIVRRMLRPSKGESGRTIAGNRMAVHEENKKEEELRGGHNSS